MLRGKTKSTGLIRLASPHPVHVMENTVEVGRNQASEMIVYVNGLLDPVKSLEMDAFTIEVGLLSSIPNSPTTLDDVVQSSDIIDNIKNMSTTIVNSHNDFVQNNVIIEQMLSVSDVINTYAPGFAYEYEQTSDFIESINTLPTVSIARTKDSASKKEINDIDTSEINFEKNFTYARLNALFDNTPIPQFFTLGTSGLMSFYFGAPAISGKMLSSIMHYPFPVSQELSQYRDYNVCPFAEDVQTYGMKFLDDSDFKYPVSVKQYVGETYETSHDSKGEVITRRIPTEAANEINTLLFGSTLSSAYSNIIAYTNRGIGDILVLPDRTYRLLEFQLPIFVSNDIALPPSAVLSVIVRNSLGVIIDTIIKEIDVRSLKRDHATPKYAPEISIISTQESIAVSLTQFDDVATSIMLMVKSSSTEPFSIFGVYPVEKGETFNLQIQSLSLMQSHVFRAVAVINPQTPSRAFHDVYYSGAVGWRNQGVEGQGPDVGDVDNPQYSNLIGLLSRHKASDTGGYDVQIRTKTLGRPGVVDRPTSLYSTLTCRRLDEAENPDDPAVGVILSVLGDPDVVQAISPGGAFRDFGALSGTYIYVIDGINHAGLGYTNIQNTVVRIQDPDVIEGHIEVLRTEIRAKQEVYEIRVTIAVFPSPDLVTKILLGSSSIELEDEKNFEVVSFEMVTFQSQTTWRELEGTNEWGISFKVGADEMPDSIKESLSVVTTPIFAIDEVEPYGVYSGGDVVISKGTIGNGAEETEGGAKDDHPHVRDTEITT